ncbi:hypothetical protein [Streptomyces sp. P9-A2]
MTDSARFVVSFVRTGLDRFGRVDVLVSTSGPNTAPHLWARSRSLC